MAYVKESKNTTSAFEKVVRFLWLVAFLAAVAGGAHMFRYEPRAAAGNETRLWDRWNHELCAMDRDTGVPECWGPDTPVYERSDSM